jgi:hypothetical protein
MRTLQTLGPVQALHRSWDDGALLVRVVANRDEVVPRLRHEADA